MRTLGGATLIAVAVGLAGCSSSTPSSTPATTGTGAAPSSSSGAASAHQLGQIYVMSLQNGDYASFCTYATADQVAKCKSDIALVGPSTTFKHIVLGSVVVQGSQALITVTGTVCFNSQCQSGTNPDAATANSTFAQTWALASDASNPNGSLFISAAVEQGGRWYATGF